MLKATKPGMQHNCIPGVFLFHPKSSFLPFNSLINLLRLFLWLPALLLYCSILTAQVNVAVVFDRASIETGDTFVMKVIVSGTNAKPDRVDFSAWKDVLPNENILRRSAWEKSAGRWTSQYTLIFFDALDQELPPLTVLSLAGEPAQSSPVALKVTATPAPNDIEKMEPIRDIKHEPLLWSDFALLLGLIGLGYGIYYFIFKKKKPAPVAIPVEMPAPVEHVLPHALALQKLKKLEQTRPWQHGKIKDYYADLSHILKEYVETRFQVPALESTTREVEILLKNKALQEGRIMTLINVLRQTDLAKYAQALGPDRPHEQFLMKAEEFVQKTADETI